MPSSLSEFSHITIADTDLDATNLGDIKVVHFICRWYMMCMIFPKVVPLSLCNTLNFKLTGGQTGIHVHKILQMFH